MARLREQLGRPPGPYCELTERAPNAVWSFSMFKWLLDSGAPYCLSLQDDVEVAPGFWPALDAMLSMADDAKADVLGLSSVHPVQVELARQGHRWYRTSSWLVGWAWLIRRETLAEFLSWRAEHPEIVEQLTEDSLLNHWINATGQSTWHPIPTIVDHDTTIDSSYSNDHHVHRRPFLTWRDYTAGSLADPTFWRPQGPPETVPILPTPAPHLCWTGCGRTASVGAGPIRLCSSCVAQAASVLITRGGTG